MRPPPISAAEFDRRFDDGEDLSDYLEAVRPGESVEHMHVTLTFRSELAERLDAYALAEGLPREDAALLLLLDALDRTEAR